MAGIKEAEFRAFYRVQRIEAGMFLQHISLAEQAGTGHKLIN
jgi:hypothetical protein